VYTQEVYDAQSLLVERDAAEVASDLLLRRSYERPTFDDTVLVHFNNNVSDLH